MRILATALSLTLLAFSAPAQGEISQAGLMDAWLDHARHYIEENPDNPGCEGLRHLVTAQEQFNFQACLPHESTMDAIRGEGWNAPHPEIVELLRIHGPTLRGALAAAEAGAIAFPPAEHYADPPMSFRQMLLMFNLMSVDARRLEAVGDVDRAAHRLVQAVRLADLLCAEDAMEVQHVVGLAGMEESLRALAEILRGAGLSDQALRDTARDLALIDRRHLGLAAAMRTEGRCFIETMRDLRQDPNLWANLEGQFSDPALVPSARQSVSDFASFEAEHSRVWGEFIANCERPLWERERMDEPWFRRLTGDPFLLTILPMFVEHLPRGEIAIGHLRLSRALCALRLGEEETLSDLIDPFTGEPLRLSEDRVWSLGPDQTDQRSQTEYDPTNGTVSGGDIVALRSIR